MGLVEGIFLEGNFDLWGLVWGLCWEKVILQTMSSRKFLNCLQDAWTKLIENRQERSRRYLIDLFSDRASSSDINEALLTNVKDMKALQAFSTSILANEHHMNQYVTRLKTDFSFLSSKQRLLTLYHELAHGNSLDIYVMKTQGSIQDMRAIYNEMT